MEYAIGWLGLSPDAFWSMTLRELICGIDGFIHAKGGETAADKAQAYDELLALMDTMPEKTLIEKPSA